MSADILFPTFTHNSLNTSEACPSRADNELGPQVLTCRRSFDFTLLFEQSILSILPSVIFLLAAFPRVALLLKRPLKLRGKHLQLAKQLALVVYTLLQLAALVASAFVTVQTTRASVAATSLSFIVACVLCLLSYLEHTRSIRPSAIIEVYLIFSLLFDATRDRTLWLSYPHTLNTVLFTSSSALKCILLFLESQTKRAYLNLSGSFYGREETSGAFGRTFFLWLNHLIMQGFRNILSMADLYRLDYSMSSEVLSQKFVRVWRISECRVRNLS